MSTQRKKRRYAGKENAQLSLRSTPLSARSNIVDVSGM